MDTNKKEVAPDVGGLTRYDHRGCLMVPDPGGDYCNMVDVRALLATKAAAAGTSAPLTEQQVADMLAASDIVTEFGHRTLINGEPMHARLGFLTQFANHVLATTPVPQVSAAEQPDWDSLTYPPKALLKREDWDQLTRKPKAPAEQPSTPVPRVGGNTSIDTPEFRDLYTALNVMVWKGTDRYNAARKEFIGYIDAHVARQPAAATADEDTILAIATAMAEKVAKNASVPPNLCFPHIYLGLKDAVAALPVARQAQSAPTDLSKRLSEAADAVMLQETRQKLMLTAADEIERLATQASAQAAPADLRDAALEEAAKVCEIEICSCCWQDDAQAAAEHLAERIRALRATSTDTAKD